MHVYERGNGPAALLLHGAPSTPAHYGALVDALAPRWRVLVPDLPGYGKSPPLEGPHDLERVQALLEDALLARGIRQVAVVGHSLGGWRALALATATRVETTKVVTLGGFAWADEESRHAFRENAALLRQGFDFGAHILPLMAAPGFPERHPREAAELVCWLSATTTESLASELEAAAACEDLRPKLAQMSVPVLARVGSLDRPSPPERSEAIARAARFGTLQVVAGCGHALLYEDRAATVDAVRGFLEASATLG